jgi:hypothetical protein
MGNPKNKETAVKNSKSIIAIICFCALFLALKSTPAQQAANFVGTWQITPVASGQGGQGGQGGEGENARRGGGGGEQSITITQDGDKYKVSHQTRRGDNSYDATVSGNTISWTEQRQRRDGQTMQIQYSATLDGDTMKGTMGGGQFSREFTAKRAASNPNSN